MGCVAEVVKTFDGYSRHRGRAVQDSVAVRATGAKAWFYSGDQSPLRPTGRRLAQTPLPSELARLARNGHTVQLGIRAQVVRRFS